MLQPQRMADFMGEGLATVLVLMDLVVDEGMVLGVIPGLPGDRRRGVRVIRKGIGAARAVVEQAEFDVGSGERCWFR